MKIVKIAAMALPVSQAWPALQAMWPWLALQA
jgi:hypothetical protein